MEKEGTSHKKILKNEISELIDKFVPQFLQYGVLLDYEFRYINVGINKLSNKKLFCVIIRFQISNRHYKKSEDSTSKEYSFRLFKFFSKKQKEVGQSKRSHTIVKKFLERKYKQLQKKGSYTICKTVFFDIFKFIFLPRYFYKDKFYGINIKTITFIISAIIGFIFVVLTYYVRLKYYRLYGHFPLW